MPINSNLVLIEQVYGPTENDRLNLFYIPRDGGFDFHSLVWERENINRWQMSATVTREQFQGAHSNRRFVTGLYSLDPQRGWAVLKIGEGNSLETSSAVTFNYSWRSWDLVRCCEIGKLKDCNDPFDSLD